MKTLHKEIQNTLHWIPVGSSRRKFELRGEPEVFGILQWLKHFGSLASGVTADGTWTFHRSGLLHLKASVRNPGSHQEVAIFRGYRMGTGVVEFATGLKLYWTNKNVLRSMWAFTHPNGSEILGFQSLANPLKLQILVNLQQDLTEIPLLACLGLYLLVLKHEGSVAEKTITVPIMTSA